MPITPDPSSLDELLVFAEKEFRINDLRQIQAPPWEAKLL
jgi:hypothetical protein